MNRGWFSYLAVIFLLALLAVLATLQYRWLGQISDAEGVRLAKRLKDDTHRFANDFNREIQKAYFSFQIDAGLLEAGDLRGLRKRYLFWKQETLEPNLIKGIYLVEEENKDGIKRFDPGENALESIDWPDVLTDVRVRLRKKIESASIEGDSLIVPIFKSGPDVTQLIVTRKIGKPDLVDQERHMSVPEKYGYVIVRLDRDVIRDNLLPGLAAKYFSKEDGGSFELSVSDQEGNAVYTTSGEHFQKGDASEGLFSLHMNDFSFFSKNLGNLVIDERMRSKSRVVFRESFTKEVRATKDGDEVDVEVSAPDKENNRFTVIEEHEAKSKGAWKLYVRHSSGSLEQFIADTRNRNLAISFGILGILAAGMVLVVISSQRARALAMRQLDFVSSVSHEFRTPLAVIYSAGENISDGVIESSKKLADYGNLIKREGRKLSEMVEQILEHAGANSGNTKYEFRSTEVAVLLDSVLDEYQPIIEENGFVLERDIAPGLPLINADEGTFKRAMQNLVANALKYSNGEKWIGVTARNGGGEVRISVKDRGIGISNDDQKHIFEPFYRARRVVDDQISGNGLGLSLVKRIVDAHGGTVSVKSEIGRGTEFTIVVPAAEE